MLKKIFPCLLYTHINLFTKPAGVYEKSPHQSMPPPAYPVLENKYTQMTVFSPKSELKLYPPVLVLVLNYSVFVFVN